MNWFEELPDKCPPDEAEVASGQSFYRLLNSDVVSENDFISYKRLFPNREFRNKECQAAAISVFSNVEDCLIARKLPAQKNKKKYIGEIILDNADGVIANTPNNKFKDHFSWWRSKGFDLTKVKVVEYEK